jgi:hypothetical protein
MYTLYDFQMSRFETEIQHRLPTPEIGRPKRPPMLEFRPTLEGLERGFPEALRLGISSPF